MVVLGLTGKSGSGKSVVADILKARGAYVIDCDSLYNDMVIAPSDCTRSIASAFGNDVLNSDGSLNRKALGSLVFGVENKEKLDLLNSTVHPFVFDEIKKIISEISLRDFSYCVIDAPQLFEAGVDRICDFTVVVTAEEEQRISRIMSRDQIDLDAAQKRIASQLDDAFFTQKADFIIDNSGAYEDLLKAVDTFIEKLEKGVAK